MLAVGCRYVVSFDGFSGGVQETTTGNGGSTTRRTTTTSSDGAGGSMGGADADASGGGGNDPEGGSTGGGSTGGGRPDASPNEPILVYQAPFGATLLGITVFGSDIYWVEQGPGRGLFRMPKQPDAGAPVPLNRTQTAYDIAVDGSYIYWLDGLNVLKIPITGGPSTPPTTVFSHNSTSPRYLAVDDQGTVYVTAADSILSGGGGSSAVPYLQQVDIAGIAFYADVDAGARRLRWGYHNGIKEGPSQGSVTPSDVQDLWTGLPGTPVQGVATDGEFVYWISNNQAVRKGEPARASAFAWCLTLTPPEELGADADIAVDDEWVYFTWPNKKSIYKCSK
jgi:hypothetical protein